jgi:hypothetical protein
MYPLILLLSFSVFFIFCPVSYLNIGFIFLVPKENRYRRQTKRKTKNTTFSKYNYYNDPQLESIHLWWFCFDNVKIYCIYKYIFNNWVTIKIFPFSNECLYNIEYFDTFCMGCVHVNLIVYGINSQWVLFFLLFLFINIAGIWLVYHYEY